MKHFLRVITVLLLLLPLQALAASTTVTTQCGKFFPTSEVNINAGAMSSATAASKSLFQVDGENIVTTVSNIQKAGSSTAKVFLIWDVRVSREAVSNANGATLINCVRDVRKELASHGTIPAALQPLADSAITMERSVVNAVMKINSELLLTYEKTPQEDEAYNLRQDLLAAVSSYSLCTGTAASPTAVNACEAEINAFLASLTANNQFFVAYPPVSATGKTILIEASQFNPTSLSIGVGESVTWINNSGKNALLDLNGTSYPLVNGETYQETFTAADTITYKVLAHTEIGEGTLTVGTLPPPTATPPAGGTSPAPTTVTPAPGAATTPTVSGRLPIPTLRSLGIPGFNLFDPAGKPVLKDPAGTTGIQKLVSLLAEISGWLLSLLVALAILMFIIAGYMFITAAGDDEKITKAKNIVKWVIIGLVVAMFSWTFIKIMAIRWSNATPATPPAATAPTTTP